MFPFAPASAQVSANPPTYNVTWRHNGKRLAEDVEGGVLHGNHTLVLQKVALAAGGLYTCVASNTIADGESNAALLDIKFQPACTQVRPCPRHQKPSKHLNLI